MQSFRTCPSAFKQKPENLIGTGFFHIGELLSNLNPVDYE
jgi:hypothetical protein